MTMPGLTHKSPQFCNPSSGSIADCHGGFGSSLHRDGVDASQLHRFWGELSSAARHDLLRIDKHSLFEQVRKNLYCSRCNGLLLEAFSQIIAYSKSLQGGSLCHGKHAVGCNKAHCERSGNGAVSSTEDDVRDPSVHPWGGLTATRDSMLTFLDCFLDGQPLEVIQNVCDCARARERERELFYPDACGGGGRGWISQGNCGSGSGRGHSLKETCALHTARLSCDALVDFWSALGEETRRSLLRMKEEDFIARLMFRFDSKRFCRDCRRNVLRELKELKELKRSRKELKCTRWFCNADTAFRYEVSNTSVQVNWRECFGGDLGNTYQHFEWGLGSAEGNADILGFEDVGLSEGARVDGLDLEHISLFYITLRAWKHDGRCTEVSVKAHALKGRHCVHRRLLVGDGHITITKGESIKRFFEHAEEVEEEEDEDGMEKNGSEPESEGFRVQKHAKSPELARDFLLDAATIIFKEQVEKAFREGTARQNAHTIFVCLALNLLEERIHVACKEISTLEKQKQLLEEEEHEKREEEQRRERKRLKEKEKKMRRKEKQKGRERDKEKGKSDSHLACNTATDCDSGAASLLGENEDACTDGEAKESSRVVDGVMLDDDLVAAHSSSLDSMEVRLSAECSHLNNGALHYFDVSVSMDRMEDTSTQDNNGTFILERSKAARRRSKMRKGPFTEILSRRFIRRSSVMALDLGAGSRACVKLSCDSVREMSEKVLVGTQKHHRGATKSDRNAGPSSIEGWNNPRYQQRQTGHVSQISSKRIFYAKSKHNDTGWVGKECVATKSFERKHAVAMGSKQVCRVGNFVSGPMQCNWQIIKATPSDGVKRGLADQYPMAHSEVVLSNSSSESEKTVESSLAGCKGGLSKVSGNCVEVLGSSDQQDVCGLSSSSLSSFAREELQNDLATSGDGCPLEASDSSSTSPPAELESSSNEKPLCRLVPISTAGSLDEDTSPSSAASCVTDTSDGGLTGYSMTTESSYLESSFPSIEASTAELSPPVPSDHQEPYKESMHFSSGNEDLLKYDFPSFKPDDYHAFSPIEGLPCPEFYPYSSAPNLLAYIHEYSCGYEHGVNPEVSVIDVASHVCQQMDSSMQLPLLPASLLPMHPPQPFGYPWIQGQCGTTSVLNTGLLPFPSHPGSLYVDGLGQSTGGLTAALLPLPPPFQHVPPVVGFTCMQALPADSSFTQWRDQRLVFEDGQKADTPALGDAFEQLEFSHQEQLPDFSGSLDVVLASNVPLNDPSGFSLFHFGSLPGDDQEHSVTGLSKESSSESIRPLDMPCGRSVKQEAAGIPKPNFPVEEYSLFTAKPSSRFGFF